MSDRRMEARPGSLEPLQDASQTWRYMAPPGITPEMVRRPDYWRNVVREAARSRQPGVHAWNKIEVIAQDGTWELDLRVVSAADGLVVTRVIREWLPDAKPGRKPQVPEGYIVEYVEANGWRALDPIGAVLASRLTIEEEAVRAASAHARKVKGDI